MGMAAWSSALFLLTLLQPATQGLSKQRRCFLSFIAFWPSFKTALIKHCLAFSLGPDMVHLSAPPVLNAECGTEAILKCDVASPKHGLSVKHMGWYRNGGPLCSVKENVLIYHNHSHSLGRFHCLYSHGHLSLGLHNVQLQDGGNSTYVCKLRSNRGATHATTRLEFKGQSTYLPFTLS